MIVWRISEHSDLTGKGGLVSDGRWHNVGQPIVYTAEHPALALCEMLVHFNSEDMPEKFQLLRIEVPDEIDIENPEFGPGWHQRMQFTRNFGDVWLRSTRSAVLRVPSALLPDSFNFLLNPEHPNFSSIKILQTTRVPLDYRFR